MKNLEKGIKNAIMNSRNGYISFGTNNPYSEDSQNQYYANTTKAYYAENMKYASNVVLAQVQGVNYNDFYTFTPLRIRTAMVIDPTTGNNLGSDWQRIAVENTNIDFLPRGAKVVFNGNTWIVTNPMNIESVIGTSVIRRCNATWHYLDAYGNVQSEPFCYGQGAGELATTNDVKENMILMNGYQHSVMQYNENTSVLAHNMRMILGNQAFSVRGLQNFVQEFTADEDSVHIQFFELAKTEPLEIDDMDAKVAGGKAFQWRIDITGQTEMNQNQSQMLSAVSFVNEQPTTLATTYQWSSSNEDVATINDEGVASSVDSGTATITCTLVQNPNFTASFDIEVKAGALPTLYWDSAIPERIVQYQNITIAAGVLGTTEAPVVYTMSGADKTCYEAVQDGNQLTITCWYPSATPLRITATANGESIDASIRLEGW